MKTTKRITSLILALVMLSFGMLVSCGNDDPAETTPATPDTTGTTSAPETTKAPDPTATTAPEADATTVPSSDETTKTPDAPDEPIVKEPNYTNLELNFNDPNLCTSQYEANGEGGMAVYGAWSSTGYISTEGWYGFEYNLASHYKLMSVSFFTADKKYISGIGTNSISATNSVTGFTTVPENAKYVRFITWISGSGLEYPAFADSLVHVYTTKEAYDEDYNASEFRGKLIAFIGDSITDGQRGTLEGGVHNRSYRNYPYFLTQKLGCSLANFARSGANAQSYYEELYQKGVVRISDADVIVVMLGVNRGLDGVYGTAYLNLINAILKDKKEDAVLILVTPISATIDSSRAYPNRIANVQSSYNAVKLYAEMKKLPWIDAFKYSPIQPAMEDVYQIDGLHITEEGAKAFADYMADEVAKILREQSK